MNKTLINILVNEFQLDPEEAERIINRIMLFQKRDREKRGEIVLPINEVQQGMQAVRAYKELLERMHNASPHPTAESIIMIQDMRNLEFRMQEYIFAHS